MNCVCNGGCALCAADAIRSEVIIKKKGVKGRASKKRHVSSCYVLSTINQVCLLQACIVAESEVVALQAQSKWQDLALQVCVPS